MRLLHVLTGYFVKEGERPETHPLCAASLMTRQNMVQ
jgi:hypothetical protein